MNACIIFNPVARGEKARRFREQISGFSGQCVLKPTTGPGAGWRLAAEAVREGFQTIVAAGGDGTLNEVLNGIGEAPDGFARVRLGLLPLGTVNVFARELGLPMTLTDGWRVIQAGREKRVDVAVASYRESGRPARRLFVQMAGAGLDARAIELVDWQVKKKIGPLAYVLSGFKAMRGPLPKIVASNGRESHTGELVLLGNGRFYGGRFVLFPEAALDDGLLEVTVFPRAGWRTLLRCVPNLVRGRPPALGQAVHIRGSSITLTCPDPAPFHVEGENVGRLPATFSVQSAAVRVLVP